MASRLLHYLIANQIIEDIKIDNKNRFLLGYYCRLIMDCLWVSLIVNPYVRKGLKSERVMLYHKAYRDYWRLNYILTREFNLEYQLCVDEDIYIEEIDCNQISNLADNLKMDIECNDYASKEDMELYPYEIIENYIKYATEVCRKELLAFKNGERHMCPIVYYVTI